jgi:uncharacterized protein
MNATDPTPIRHNAAENRYELEVGGRLALLEYAMESGRMIITHTFVPPELRGRGLAEKLVRRALDDARAQNAHVVPACSYVAAFIQRHAEYQPLLANR